MTAFPAGFTRRLLDLGLARVLFAYHWHSDETQIELEAVDGGGQPLCLTPGVQGELREAIHHAQVGGDGTYLWDLVSGVVAPFGQLTYLTGDSLGGTYEVTFRGDPGAVLAAATTPAPTPEQVQGWVTSADPNVRAAVAGNLHVPARLVRALSGDLDRQVLEALQRRPHAPSSIPSELTRARDPRQLPRTLDALARSPWAQVRRAAAGNPSTPARTLRALGSDPEWRVKFAVLGNPAADDDVQAALMHFFTAAGPELRRQAAREEPVFPPLLTAYATDPDAVVRAAVVSRVGGALGVLATLRADPHPLVQEALEFCGQEEDRFDESWPADEQWRVARHPTSSEALWALCTAPNLRPDVRAFLLTRPAAFSALLSRGDVTDEELGRMVRCGALPVWSLPARPLRPELHRALLPQLGAHERGELARRADLPADVRDALMADPGGEVQRTLAQKAPLDEALARRLAASPNPWTAGALLENPTLPLPVAREVLERLGPGALNPYIHTRDPLPAGLLGVYAEFATGDVLLNLAANPATPALPVIEQLRALGPDAVQTLLGDSATPADLLARLVLTPHDLLLVRHPNFTAAHLRSLVTQGVQLRRFWNAHGEEAELITRLIGAILDSPLMTPDLWDTLVTVQNLRWEQRRRVASRSDLPRFIARRLIEDPVQAVAQSVRRGLWPDL